MGVMARRVALAGLGALVGFGAAALLFAGGRPGPRTLVAEAAGDGKAETHAEARVPLDLYLRRWQGIPADVQIQVEPGRPTPVAGLEAVTVGLTKGDRTQRFTLLRSADSRYLVPSSLLDMGDDPYAAVAARLDLKDRPGLGRADAPVTVVEYSSFQCPFCRKLAPVVKETMEGTLGKEVRWVYKHFPLTSQPWSEPAAVAAECARRVGGDAKFWALHDVLFDQQASLTPQDLRPRSVAWAKAAGLHLRRFERCVDDPEAKARVQEDLKEGQAIGVNSTPTLVINGRVAPGAVSTEELAGVLQSELAYRRALAGAKAVNSEGGRP
jgi:protein-disulfide isomerase